LKLDQVRINFNGQAPFKITQCIPKKSFFGMGVRKRSKRSHCWLVIASQVVFLGFVLFSELGSVQLFKLLALIAPLLPINR
jgi:hypothetical protein